MFCYVLLWVVKRRKQEQRFSISFYLLILNIGNKMTKLLEHLRIGVVYIKFYIQRSTSFLSVINSAMLLYLFTTNLSEKGILNFSPEKYTILIILIGFFGLISFGAIDIHIFKSNQSEQILNYKYNPAMVQIGEDIKEIKKEILELKNAK